MSLNFLKKSLSLLLTLCLCLTAFSGVLLATGITASAAGGDVSEELWLYNGYERALLRGERVECAPPYEYPGTNTAVLPVSPICDYTGATMTKDGNTVTVTTELGNTSVMTVGSLEYTYNGQPKEFLIAPSLENGDVYLSNLSVRAVFGINLFHNSDIGLTVISENQMAYDKGYASLEEQISALGGLLFDRPSGEQIYNDVAQGVGLESHPRILVDSDRFDYLRSVYRGEVQDGPLEVRIKSFISTADSFISGSFETVGNSIFLTEAATLAARHPYYIYDENGNRLVGESEYTYVDAEGKTVTLVCEGSGVGDGYDEGGRLNQAAGRTRNLKSLAFAWQMTGEKKYADAFYLYALELGKWEHWGDGHFLNCADAAVEYAIGLDWIWHAYDNSPAKRGELARILYEKGLLMGYYSVTKQKSKMNISTVLSSGWSISERENNWQTVCGSGMIISALALMELEEYKDEAIKVMDVMIKSLELCLVQYAPDGAYIESPSYWSYGTSTYFLMLQALKSSCGTDYGYLDTVGLYESCYYSQYISNSDRQSWSFHDSERGMVDTDCYHLAASLYSDAALGALREEIIKETGAKLDIIDVLFYNGEYAESDIADLPLDKLYRGIDTVTMRSSWESGANFAGLHAGANNVHHGDIDSGNFVLEMNGILWVGDPGKEDYNVGNYFSGGVNAPRYKYYRKSLEAHNAILIKSDALPRGQVFNSMYNDYAKITDFYSDENGAYAIANMKAQYGSACSAAKRGLLFTNSRTTVVIQDEISFSSPTSLCWIAAVNGSLTLSEDGRTAYFKMYDKAGKLQTLRATLLSEDESLVFEVKEDGTILPDTVTKDNSGNEKASNPQRRLLINANDVTEFKVAVVFEIIRHEDEVVGYELTPSAEWKTVSDEWVKEENSDIIYPEDIVPPKYGLAAFKSALSKLEKASTPEERAKLLFSTVVYLTDYDKTNAKVVEAVEEYTEYVNEYNKDIAEINSAFQGIFEDFCPAPSLAGR